MKTINRLLWTWVLTIVCLSTFARSEQQVYKTSYMQLNQDIMEIYHELDSIFPLRYLANESPADCGYWVNYNFTSRKEFELYRPWLESLLKRMEGVDAYSRTTQTKDSVNNYLRATELSPTTPNNIQKDRSYLYITQDKVSFYYRAKIEGQDFHYNIKEDDANGQPRQDIADKMDALLNQYIKDKNVTTQPVKYDAARCNYKFVSFSSKYETAQGYRYIVPNCKPSDYQKFRNAIRSYSRTAPVRTSCNDVYWQYDESAICIFRPNTPNPLIIAAALKGTDLYLIRLEGYKSCFLPRAWAEDNPMWNFKDYYKLTGSKPLAPPAIKKTKKR